MNDDIKKNGAIIMKLMKINDVQPGMILAKTVLNDDYIVVLAENTMLTKAHITRLNFLNVGELYIKDDYDLDVKTSIVQSMLSRSHAFLRKYEEILGEVESIFIEVEKGNNLPVEKIHKLIKDNVTAMVYQSGAMEYLYQLKSSSNSVYNHSLRVSILAGVLAKWMHGSREMIEEAILAGFLHDIGKTKMDSAILEKHIENLNEEEKLLYIQHTVDGYHLLANHDELSEGVKYAVMQHHERNDGTGFPFGSRSEDINLYAKMIAVVDIYDNITTERQGSKKQTPFHAIKAITKDMFTSLEPEVCIAFINRIQQVFLGSEVTLNDKRVGNVIYYPQDYAALPIVRLKTGEIIDFNNNRKLDIVEYTPSQM